MTIDEQLLEQNNASEGDEEIDGESLAAGNLREDRRSFDIDESINPNASIREQVQQDKRRRAAQSEIDERRQISREFRDNPIRKTTDSILKFAWTNLIDSFGLTLLWIDIHFFLNKVFGPKVFRELGEEWIPSGIKKLGDQKSKEAAAMLTIAEKAGCGCLNLGCLFLVIASLSTAALIATAVFSPFQTLYDTIKSGGLSELLTIVKSSWFK